MRTVLDQLITGLPEGPVALARIVSATGSAPSAVGTAMLVSGSGEVTGSLSAGCVDAAVIDSAGEVLATGAAVLDEFGVDESGGFGVGLLCGGTIEVFTERVDRSRLPMLHRLRDLIGADSPVALATTLSESPEWQLRETGNRPGWLGLDRDIDDLLAAGRSGIVGIADCDDPDGTPRPRALVQTFAPPRRLILVGANDFVRELAALGRQLGMRVTVVDARPVFATAARFPAADEVAVEWPDRYLSREIEAGRIGASTAVCVLTHDTKFDVPALIVALRPYGNEVILMVKSTSLASTITIMEITGIAAKLISESYRTVEVFACAGAIYLILNFIVARLFTLTHSALMQIGWFARFYRWFVPWKDLWMDAIRASWPWRVGRVAKRAVKRRTALLWQTLRTRLRRFWGTH